jgi:hypothetical protein
MDAPALAFFIRTERVRPVEEAEMIKGQKGSGINSKDNSSDTFSDEEEVTNQDTEQPISLKLLRWRFV